MLSIFGFRYDIAIDAINIQYRKICLMITFVPLQSIFDTFGGYENEQISDCTDNICNFIRLSRL